MTAARGSHDLGHDLCIEHAQWLGPISGACGVKDADWMIQHEFIAFVPLAS